MPFPLQDRRWAEVLRRLFNILGHVPLTLVEDVQPVFDLFGPRFDLLAPRGEASYAGTASVNAVAGQFSSVSLANNIASGKLVVLELIDLWHPITNVVNFGFSPGVTSTVARTPLDRRSPPGAPAGVPMGASNAAQLVPVAGRLWQTVSGQTFHTTIEFPVLLLPGTTFTVENDLVNFAINGSFRWYERPATDYERTLA